jgi:hypothetical protein
MNRAPEGNALNSVPHPPAATAGGLSHRAIARGSYSTGRAAASVGLPPPVFWDKVGVGVERGSAG